MRDLFDALASPLRERILARELAPGTFLPSESELACAAGVGRYSIRKALSLLRDEGLIEPVAGRGWAVLDGQREGAAGRSGLLRYRQVADGLRAAIAAGRFGPASALPSEADLMARHGVSRGTVRHAFALLEADGLIRTQPGKGRYVTGA